MQQNDLVSVILPVYNAQKYLREAIESVLNQTYENFEFIIINDGSEDGSLEIIKEYQKQDSRILLTDRQNKGLVYTLNEAIDKARGKYIARMDADDISLKERFEKQVQLMQKEGVDVCGCHYLLVDESNSIDALNLTPRFDDMCMLSLASLQVPFAHPSVMIRGDFLRKNALYYGRSPYIKAEDFDMWMRMKKSGAKFANADEILFRYRIVKNSLSKINNKEIVDETKKLSKEFFEQNKEEIGQILKTLSFVHLNSQERSLVARMVFKFCFEFDFSYIKHLKQIDKKSLICAALTEIYNR